MRGLGFGIGTGKMKGAHGDERARARANAHVGEDGDEGGDGVPVHGWQHPRETWREDGHTRSGF